jgi:hypothetical protein
VSAVYSITLTAGGPAEYGDDGYETNYCGCYSVVVPDSEVKSWQDRLHPLGLGLAADEDGTVCRCWFLEDELDDMLAQAAAETGCYVEESEVVA